MIVVTYNQNDVFTICWENEKETEMSARDFFEKILPQLLISGAEIYMPLQIWGMAFVKKLYDLEYEDITKEKILDNELKLSDKEFSYIFSSDNGAFFSITAKTGKKYFKVFEIKNLVAVLEDDLKKTFGGSLAVAYHRAIASIRAEGVRASTISSCAYNKWRQGFDRNDFNTIFVDNDEVSEKICRDAYHGGLCMVWGERFRAIEDCIVLDVNSLYPHVLKSRKFAIGVPHLCSGKPPLNILLSENKTFYVRFRASFELKEGYLPFLRTRCDKRHWQGEILYDSNYVDCNGEVFTHDENGPLMVELSLYKPEFELMFEHYDVKKIEFIEYVWYRTSSGLFDKYVDRFYYKKSNAKTPGERRISKVFLVALTGILSFKKERHNYIIKKEDTEEVKGSVLKMRQFNKKRFGKGKEELFLEEVSAFSDRKSHIAIGAAVTSEAMVMMVRIAQQNIKYFKYTDTDSLHLKCSIDQVKGLKISDKLGDFKLEHEFKVVKYHTEKVYQYYDKEDKYHVVCAGLPYESRRFLENLYNGEEVDKAYEEAFWDLNAGHVEEVLDEGYIRYENEDGEYELRRPQKWVGPRHYEKASIPVFTQKVVSFSEYKTRQTISFYRLDKQM